MLCTGRFLHFEFQCDVEDNLPPWVDDLVSIMMSFCSEQITKWT